MKTKFEIRKKLYACLPMFTKGLIWGVTFLLFSYISAKLRGRVIMISDRILFFLLKVKFLIVIVALQKKYIESSTQR